MSLYESLAWSDPLCCELLTGEIDLTCFVQIEMNGLTGKIKFDQRGQRSDFELDIIELKRDGLTRVIKHSCVRPHYQPA